MEQKVAIVTGSGRGIGRGVALELAANGFAVMLAARSESQLAAVAGEIAAAGARAAYCVCDVSRAKDVRALFEECGMQLGAPSVLVNNAGSGQFVSTVQTSDEIWERTIGANLTGAFYCCREAIAVFEKAGGGLIINNASVAAVRSFPGFAAYSASKAGVVGFSRSLREEVRAINIRVSVVMAGATDTPFWDKVEGEWDRKRMVATQHVATLIAMIALQPPELQVEEITIMPAGGAL